MEPVFTVSQSSMFHHQLECRLPSSQLPTLMRLLHGQAFCARELLKGMLYLLLKMWRAWLKTILSRILELTLKCPYDQIFDFHFFTFSCTIRPSYSSCQISIHYEHQKSFYFNIYFQEFTAAINQPCSKAWLQMGESDVKDSNIPHGLKL